VVRAAWLICICVVTAACGHATAVAPKDVSAQPAMQAAKPSPAPGGPPLAMSPAAMLKPGAASLIEEALDKHGFPTQHTGTLGAATERQLARFQKQQGLADTGLPDRATVRRLGLDPDAIYQATSK
jgi:hypothetical protein